MGQLFHPTSWPGVSLKWPEGGTSTQSPGLGQAWPPGAPRDPPELLALQGSARGAEGYFQGPAGPAVWMGSCPGPPVQRCPPSLHVRS